MFSAIATSVISAGASKMLSGGGKAGKVAIPKFSKKQAKTVKKIPNVGTRDVTFEEFADIGTAGQMTALISRHESLMKAVDTSQGSVKGSVSRSTLA